MSRSFGDRSLTTRPPIETVPSEISSSPGDHAQGRRLAAARRADEHEELAVADVERETVHGRDAVLVDLVDVSKTTSATGCSFHRHISLQTWKGGRRRAGPPRRFPRAPRRRRAARARARRAPRAAAGPARGRRGLARQRSRSPASRGGTRSRRRRRRVADPAAGERVARAAQRDQAAVLGEKRRVPGVRPVPRHRAPGVLAPVALEAELVAGEDHRHARRRHLQPDADELPLARAGDRAEARRVVAVEERPGVEDGRPRHAGAERRASSRRPPGPPSRGRPTGTPQKPRRSSAGSSSPRSHVHTGRRKPA